MEVRPHVAGVLDEVGGGHRAGIAEPEDVAVAQPLELEGALLVVDAVGLRLDVHELGELVHIETETDRVNHMEGTFQLQRLSYRDTSFLADSSLLPKVAVPETVEN